MRVRHNLNGSRFEERSTSHSATIGKLVLAFSLALAMLIGPHAIYVSAASAAEIESVEGADAASNDSSTVEEGHQAHPGDSNASPDDEQANPGGDGDPHMNNPAEKPDSESGNLDSGTEPAHEPEVPKTSEQKEPTEPPPPATDTSGAWFTEEANDAAGMQRGFTGVAPGPSARNRITSLDTNAALLSLVGADGLAAATPGQRVLVPVAPDVAMKLFDDEVAKISVTEAAVTLPYDGGVAPTVEIIGSQEIDGQLNNGVSMVFAPDDDGHYALLGNVETGQSSDVIIRQVADDTYRIDEIDPELANTPAEEHDDAILAPVDGSAEPAPEINTNLRAATIHNIDLLVGYTNGNGGNIRGEISAQVAAMNQALKNSRVNARLTLLETRAVNAKQTGRMTNELYAMQEGTGAYADLHHRRAAIGADLVALIVPNYTATECGIAFLPGSYGAAEYGYSVSARDCFWNSTFLHEVGHTLGGDHNHEVLGREPLPFPYSAGRAVSGVARSLMAYECSGKSCARKQQFANPSIGFFGSPSIASGVAGKSDVARSMNNLAPIISQYNTRPKALSTVTPSISGVAKPGVTLTAKCGGWGPSGVKMHYQWLKNGVSIPGATSTTYTPKASELRAEIHVKVTGSLVGHLTESKTSPKVTVRNPLASTPAPTITGKTTVGETVTATVGTWKPATVTLKYQWNRNGKAIKGATNSKYKLTKNDAGSRLTVTVTGSKSGFEAASRTSPAIKLKGAPPVPTKSPFLDITTRHRFFRQIAWMNRTGLSTGTSTLEGAVYADKADVTREAMAAFLYRLDAQEGWKPPAKSPFVDVPVTHKFYKQIAWMADTGISTGTRTPEGVRYEPKAPVSREAMAAFLYRLDAPKNYKAQKTSPFAEVSTSHRFYREISWMHSSGLSTGTKQATGKPVYQPKDSVTREAMAAFLYRLETSR